MGDQPGYPIPVHLDPVPPDGLPFLTFSPWPLLAQVGDEAARLALLPDPMDHLDPVATAGRGWDQVPGRDDDGLASISEGDEGFPSNHPLHQASPSTQGGGRVAFGHEHL